MRYSLLAWFTQDIHPWPGLYKTSSRQTRWWDQFDSITYPHPWWWWWWWLQWKDFIDDNDESGGNMKKCYDDFDKWIKQWRTSNDFGSKSSEQKDALILNSLEVSFRNTVGLFFVSNPCCCCCCCFPLRRESLHIVRCCTGVVFKPVCLS